MQLFNGEEKVEVIIDNILVHGKGQEEHNRCLKRVFSMVKEVGLILNKKKPKLRQSHVSYFGPRTKDFGQGRSETTPAENRGHNQPVSAH